MHFFLAKTNQKCLTHKYIYAIMHTYTETLSVFFNRIGVVKMAKDMITKDYAAERIGDMLKNLRWVSLDDMVRDLEQLKSQLENNDPDWRDTWDSTILGCDPWGLGGMESALFIKQDLEYADIEADEETA